MKLTLMYFSPTHTTKKIVSAVGKVFFERLLCKTEIVDLTRAVARMKEYVFSQEDVLIFGAPVYAGRVPLLLGDVLKNMKGNGARAVVLSVYGNRDYDDALLETKDLFSAAGFQVCAAAAFIGEHSYTEKVGARRPDRDDLVAAESFGVIAYEKVSAGQEIQKSIRGNRPYKALSPSMGEAKKAPVIVEESCTGCKHCVEVCPVNNLAADLSDTGKCIGCAACVKLCPTKARVFKDAHIDAVRQKLEANCMERKNPEFFI